MSLTIVIILFFITALVYSSVGFGGGSTYLALLLLLGISVEQVRPITLVCNIIVVLVSLVSYHKHNLILYRKVLPLVLLSVPMSFLGGMISLDIRLFKLLAGGLLVMAGVMMLIRQKTLVEKIDISTIGLTSIGGVIGAFSGMIGIGGGIFLAPVLHLSRWQSAGTIAATSSLFILVNSISGLAGQFMYDVSIDLKLMLSLVTSVFLGGLFGNKLRIRFLSQKNIRLITAYLILFIGTRLIFTNII